MRRHSLVGFASFLAASSLFWAACGDNKPSSPDGSTQDAGTGGTKDGGGTGGVGGTGGTGGMTADGGVDQIGPLCTATFVSPTDGAMLSAANGGGVGMCMTDGFHANITVATNQPDGTIAGLSVGNGPLVNAMVKGSTVTFSNVLLPQQTNLTLKVSFSTTCSTSIKVSSDCSLPACAINAPVLGASHPALNGVPATSGGDRASASGSAYQVAFKVKTDIEDGQPVRLTVTNNAVTGQQVVLSSTATGGFATFAGVTMVPDGTYNVQATCTNKAGAVGFSTSPAPYPVDTTPPDLTVSSPANGAFMGPAMLTNGAFKVCAKTTSTDAVGLPASLGDGAKNLCVAIGNGACSNPTAVTTAGTDTCVDVACPGSAPFDLNVTLTDAAGNPTKKTLTNIACASSLPGVQIISPANDDSTPAFSDKTKRLLAASSTNTLKDQAPGTAGAQWTVVACANKAGSATLYGGTKGSALAALGSPVDTVPAVAGDNCPGGYSFVARFPSATIPESSADGTGALLAATELRVDLKDATTAVGASPPVDLWVDSGAPTVSEAPGATFCGSIMQSSTDKTVTLRILSTSSDVSLTVTPTAGSPTTYTPSIFVGSSATFNSVLLPLGSDTVSATIVEPSGNTGSLAQPCVVLVGSPPIVAFTNPTSAKSLCAAATSSPSCISDGDGAAAGWQGAVSVNVTIAGAPATSGTVSFATAAGPLGQATIDSSGNATLAGVTLPEGRITITATTSDFPDHGTGSATVSPVVDTIVPSAPTALTASVLDRRQTSYQISFTAPGDASQTVSSYDVRVSTGTISDAATFAAATQVPYSGAPKAPGGQESQTVSNLYIEKQYTFAVAALDAAGNRSDPVIYTVPSNQTAHFNVTILKGPLDGASSNGFGFSIDGSTDLNADGLSDLVITERARHRVFIYNGSATFADTGPSTTITATSGHDFGAGMAVVGDINGDGKSDLAIGADLDSPPTVYIYLGGSPKWSSSVTLTESNADLKITASEASAAWLFGAAVARLGDITGDDVDDFAIGASGYGSAKGRVYVVPGSKTFTSFDLSDTTRTIVVDPANGAQSNFGTALFGIGAKTGALIVAAAGAVGGGGAVYGYTYDGSAKAFVPVGTPPVGMPVGSQIGASISLLTASSGLIIASPYQKPDTLLGRVDVRFGGSSADPFAGPSLLFQNSLSTASLNNFGLVALGGGFSGSALQLSVIGTKTPDLILGGAFEGTTPAKLYIYDGAKIPGTLGSPVDVTTTAPITLSPFPADWAGTAPRNSLVPDLNGDGYPDIAIGEWKRTSPQVQGRAVVLW